MSATLYRSGTEYVWVQVTQTRGSALTEATPVGMYFTTDPNGVPADTDFITAQLVPPTNHALSDGTNTWITLLVGPGGHTLAVGDYQVFVMVTVGSEKVVRKASVLTIR